MGYQMCKTTREGTAKEEDAAMCLGGSGMARPRCCIEQSGGNPQSCAACAAPYVGGTWQEQSSRNSWKLSQNGCSFSLRGASKVNQAAAVECDFVCRQDSCSAKV